MSVSTVQVGQSSLITFTAFTDGTQTDQGTVTVGIVDAMGDQVVAPGTSVTDASNGTYTYSLAAQSEPNFLTVTWTVSGGAVFTTYIEVVGSTLFDEYTLRNFDDDTVSSTTQYSDAAIAEAHYQACQYIEEHRARSYIRRYARIELAGSGNRWLHLQDGVSRTSTGLTLNRPGISRDTIKVISTSDGDTSNIIAADGALVRTDSPWARATLDDPLNITVEVEYGQAHPDSIAARMGMLLAKHWLVASRIPGAAASFTDPLGSYTFNESRLPYEAWQWLKQGQSVFFG